MNAKQLDKLATHDLVILLDQLSMSDRTADLVLADDIEQMIWSRMEHDMLADI